MEEYILEESSTKLLVFGNRKISVILEKLNRVGTRYIKKATGNVPPLLISKEINFLRFPTHMKNFSIPLPLYGEEALEYFEKGKIFFVENR